MTLTFQPYKAKYYKTLSEYIFALYEEDNEGQEMTQAKIDLTIKTLEERPDLGEILLFLLDETPIGYALLIHYWSNEYGGIIINLDELFVAETYRNKGVASAFLTFLKERNPQEPAIELEVMPSNDNALKLYQRHGFEMDQNKHLIFEK
jgi:GNAT superfamily N-acetyltransferase